MWACRNNKAGEVLNELQGLVQIKEEYYSYPSRAAVTTGHSFVNYAQ